ncbi:MAG: hypothetical protein KIT35_03200 [Piscinibacter sp.]|uniref:hypothetical protein n=1 Tax=Piscinibacter sp. TaxID=1903157 RepID=UPI002588E1C9|nr:hypothetical protein [Piscinibacter sp.]MCW5662819.1 hypothetical protein [Piscinibacter sp.]
MSVEDFFAEAERLKLRVDMPDSDYPLSGQTLSNEALFQLPLLAMTVLALAKSKSKPRLSEIGQLVGECLERTVVGFKGSSQHIGWSANLRIRTIKALTFLEATGLAHVDSRTRDIAATPLGRAVYERALEEESPLTLSLRFIELSYQNIRAEARIQGEVE